MNLCVFVTLWFIANLLKFIFQTERNKYEIKRMRHWSYRFGANG